MQVFTRNWRSNQASKAHQYNLLHIFLPFFTGSFWGKKRDRNFFRIMWSGETLWRFVFSITWERVSPSACVYSCVSMKRTERFCFAVRKFADGNCYFIYWLLNFFLRSASPCKDILALRQKWRRPPIFFLVLLWSERMLRLPRYTNHSKSRLYLAF